MGNANTVISKERKAFASFALGRNPECCHFYHGKIKPYIMVQSTGWERGRLRILIKIAEKDVKRETGALTWNSDYWKMEIFDFLYSPQIIES